jgi:mannose-6-phosphate isomerase-like protein (cupin superfamily)
LESFDIQALLRERAASDEDWLPFLDADTLTLGLYHVRDSDEAAHAPHARDEVYYVLSGHGKIRVQGADHPVAPGAVLFVPALQPHHFHSITEELSLLVFFSNAPPRPERAHPARH